MNQNFPLSENKKGDSKSTSNQNLPESQNQALFNMTETDTLTLFSTIKDLALMLGAGPQEIEKALEDALEKLKKSNIHELLESLEERSIRVGSPESKLTSDEKIIKLVFERIHDSIITNQISRYDGENRRMTEAVPLEYAYDRSYIISNNKHSFSGLGGINSNLKSRILAKSPTPNDRKSIDRQERMTQNKPTTENSKGSDIISSIPFFQSAVSQTAFLQFYQDMKASLIQKSINSPNIDELHKSGHSGNRRVTMLFNQVAGEIFNKIFALKAQSGDVLIGDKDCPSPVLFSGRPTKNSFLINYQKIACDPKKQMDVQIEMDFDKYLTQQTLNLMNLNSSLNEPFQIKPQILEQQILIKNDSESDAVKTPTHHSIDEENEIILIQDIHENRKLSKYSGTIDERIDNQNILHSFANGNEMSYQQLQNLCCNLLKRLSVHETEEPFINKLKSNPKCTSIFKKLDNGEVDDFTLTGNRKSSFDNI